MIGKIQVLIGPVGKREFVSRQLRQSRQTLKMDYLHVFCDAVRPILVRLAAQANQTKREILCIQLSWLTGEIHILKFHILPQMTIYTLEIEL